MTLNSIYKKLWMVKMELQIKDITLEIMELTNGNICNRCLGRSFSKTIAGPGNLIRENI